MVVDNARRLLGYLDLGDVSAQRDRDVVDRSSYRALPSATADAKLGDLIQRIHAEGSPLVILDARERVVGVVDKSTVLAALAQADSAAPPDAQLAPVAASRAEAGAQADETHADALPNEEKTS